MDHKLWSTFTISNLSRWKFHLRILPHPVKGTDSIYLFFVSKYMRSYSNLLLFNQVPLMNLGPFKILRRWTGTRQELGSFIWTLHVQKFGTIHSDTFGPFFTIQFTVIIPDLLLFISRTVHFFTIWRILDTVLWTVQNILKY